MKSSGELTEKSQGVNLALSERVTQQFYDWERRGRGWQVWEHPVELEPPFRPCIYYLPQSYPDPEAGREQTWLSRLAQFWTGGSKKLDAGVSVLPPDPSLLEPEPTYVEDGLPIREFELALPPTVDVPKAASEHLILNLSYCAGPIAFEVVGTAEKISIQYACQEQDAAQLYQQVSAHIPEGVVRETTQSLGGRWRAQLGYESAVVDFGLSHEFVRPLRTFRNFTVDPLTGAVAAMSQLQGDEVAVLQILFTPVRERWAENIFYAVTDGDGHSFFEDAPEMVSLAREKISLPLYSVVIRVAARSRFHERTWNIVRGLGSALAQYGNPSSNELIPLTNDEYPDHLHEQDLLNRLTRRSGMILNSDELVCLAHPPSPSVQTEKLNRLVLRTKSAPAVAQGHALVLGENTHNGQTTEVSLNDDQRTKHLYCVGASGTGKSTFLLNLIIQDIESGRGLAVLDPHGDLIDEALARIPENRQKDVVLFDPSDEEFPIGFNILSAHSELEKNLIASDLVAMFRRLSTRLGRPDDLGVQQCHPGHAGEQPGRNTGGPSSLPRRKVFSGTVSKNSLGP